MEWVNKYNDALDALNRDGDGAIDVILSPVHVLPTHKHGEAAGTHSLVALNLNLCWFLPRRAGCESIFALLQSKCWFSYWQQRHHTLVRVRGDIQPAGLLCWRRTHYRCEARGRLLGTKVCSSCAAMCHDGLCIARSVVVFCQTPLFSTAIPVSYV